MPSSIRLKRISDRIKEDLSELLLKGVQDPRLTGVQVTDVRVDRELAFADVFVSAVEGQARKKEVLSGLEHASGFLRSQLAANIELRTFPRLRFHWDPTPERADHIERLLASLRNEASSAPQAEEQEDDETEDSAGNE
jgi:ribosome-binding factor A